MDKGDGEFTYIGGRSKSTIDYMLTNEEGEEIIEKMEVGTNAESGHQPLIVRINKKYNRQAEKQREATMDWSENAVTEFKKRLSEKVKNGDWTEVKGKIQKAIQWREVIRDGKKKEKWWERTCHERTIQLKEMLRRCKRGNLGVKEYRKERKAYRNRIEKNKNEWNEKILEEIEKDKSEKNFWKVLNEGRKERTQICEGIEDERWLEHFKKQLEGIEIERAETNERNKERKKLEGEIKEEEIVNTIKKLKRRKATGIDGIPNEAWIEGIEQLKEELKICLKKVWKEGRFPEEWKTGKIKPIYKGRKKR